MLAFHFVLTWLQLLFSKRTGRYANKRVSAQGLWYIGSWKLISKECSLRRGGRPDMGPRAPHVEVKWLKYSRDSPRPRARPLHQTLCTAPALWPPAVRRHLGLPYSSLCPHGAQTCSLLRCSLEFWFREVGRVYGPSQTEVLFPTSRLPCTLLALHSMCVNHTLHVLWGQTRSSSLGLWIRGSTAGLMGTDF